MITWPFVYESYITNTTNTINLYRLSKSNFAQSANKFQYYDFKSALGYNLKAIFKNDKLNCSIFEDGLTNHLLVSPLVAETWGRPIEKSWCSNGF